MKDHKGKYMAEPTVIIAAISAAMQSIQTWVTVRDAKKANRTAQMGYERTSNAKLAKTQSARLKKLIPESVLKLLEDRIEKCWERYRHIIDPATGSTPEEIDKATKALKECICRELNRVYELNGSIPSGKLREWWNLYGRKS